MGSHWNCLAEAIPVDACSMCFCGKSGELSFVCRQILALFVSLHMTLYTLVSKCTVTVNRVRFSVDYHAIHCIV